MCACYGYTPAQVAGMTPTQLRYLMMHMPDVELRRAYPLAGLEATLLNALGGKPDPGEKDGKPADPARLYTPFERLPWYARPEWVSDVRTSIGVDAAQDFMRNRKRLPLWALNVAPISEITAAIE